MIWLSPSYWEINRVLVVVGVNVRRHVFFSQYLDPRFLGRAVGGQK
jgi:hypothetical protein